MRKKIFTTIIIGLLLAGLFGTTGISSNNIKQQNITTHFSQLTLQENDKYITLELSGTNSVLMRQNHYMVPIYKKTLTFPVGTEIKSVHCYPANINEQILTKKLMETPKPTLIGISSQIQNINIKIQNPKTLNHWYDYTIGAGLNGNTRCLILKIEIYHKVIKPILSPCP